MTSKENAPEWLSAQEEAAWVALTGLFLKLPHTLDADLRRRYGVSHFEYLILSCLSAAQERTLPMGDLAVLANSSPSRLSHAVSRLEGRGWISRRVDPCNARFMLARLTDAGFAFLADMAPGHVATVRAIVFDAIDPDQVKQLQAIAESIVSAMDPQHEWPPRGTRQSQK